MTFSIIIPARDEEAWIGKCLDSIDRAAAPYPSQVEVIVVANRCTDATEEIARSRGARVVHDDGKNLSRIRNEGVRHATGDIIVTIDADSTMSDNMLTEIDNALASGKYIGGGVNVKPERRSLGIFLSEIVLWSYFIPAGLSAGLFWCHRRDFEAIGGFNEKMIVAEDIVFAKALKAYGRQRGLKFKTLWKAHITTSCRKFDRFGDWFMFRFLLFRSRQLRKGLRGEDRSFPDEFFYDYKR